MRLKMGACKMMPLYMKKKNKKKKEEEVHWDKG